MSLTNTFIRNLKPKDKLYRELDGNGLYLEVAVSGRKTWLHRYTLNGNSTLRTLGHYPEMSLQEARFKIIEDKKLLYSGIKPPTKRGLHKKSTFKQVFKEWYEFKFENWSVEYAKDIDERVRNYLLPDIGHRAIDEITASELVTVLKKMETKGVLETLRRVKSIASQVFAYAFTKDLLEINPVAQISNDFFKKKKIKNYPYLNNDNDLAEVLWKFDTETTSYSFQIHAALRMLPHIFLRPGEICSLEWKEIDFDNRLIRINPQKMKMRNEHLVPISDWVLALLKRLQLVNQNKEVTPYVFPSPTSMQKHITPNALLVALRKLGIEKDKLTLHGFRHTASTMLNEAGFPSSIIELQLSHSDKNMVRSTYNKAVHLAERREMMGSWSNKLVNLVPKRFEELKEDIQNAREAYVDTAIRWNGIYTTNSDEFCRCFEVYSELKDKVKPLLSSNINY